jgi:hypothetical protein
LQERAQRDGYLFFRRLLPRADLLSVRTDMLAVVGRHGWLKQGENPGEGIIDVDAINRVPDGEMRGDVGVSAAAYDEVQKLESFHRLPHHPRLLTLYRSLFGADVFVHPRHIARMVTPHRSLVPTPPHQDFPLI